MSQASAAAGPGATKDILIKLLINTLEAEGSPRQYVHYESIACLSMALAIHVDNFPGQSRFLLENRNGKGKKKFDSSLKRASKLHQTPFVLFFLTRMDELEAWVNSQRILTLFLQNLTTVDARAKAPLISSFTVDDRDDKSVFSADEIRSGVLNKLVHRTTTNFIKTYFRREHLPWLGFSPDGKKFVVSADFLPASLVTGETFEVLIATFNKRQREVEKKLAERLGKRMQTNSSANDEDSPADGGESLLSGDSSSTGNSSSASVLVPPVEDDNPYPAFLVFPEAETDRAEFSMTAFYVLLKFLEFAITDIDMLNITKAPLYLQQSLKSMSSEVFGSEWRLGKRVEKAIEHFKKGKLSFRHLVHAFCANSGLVAAIWAVLISSCKRAFFRSESSADENKAIRDGTFSVVSIYNLIYPFIHEQVGVIKEFREPVRTQAPVEPSDPREPQSKKAKVRASQQQKIQFDGF